MIRKPLVWIALIVLLLASVSAYRIFYDDTNGLGVFGVYNLTWVNSSSFCLIGDSCISSWSDVSGSGGSDGFWSIAGSNYLINDSDVLSLNETKLNATIDYRSASSITSINCSSGNYRMSGFSDDLSEVYCRDINQSLLNTSQFTNDEGFITATLTQEQVEDYAGGMVTGNTETNIEVTYQDGDGTIDYVVSSTPSFTEVYVSGGGTVGGNNTCIILYSPDTLTTLEVCN